MAQHPAPDSEAGSEAVDRCLAVRCCSLLYISLEFGVVAKEALQDTPGGAFFVNFLLEDFRLVYAGQAQHVCDMLC